MKKSFFALCFVLICLVIIAAGCIGDSTGGFNPKGKNISEFKSGGISNVPVPGDYSNYIHVNCSMVAPLPANELDQNSDLAFYGTFKGFSSNWSRFSSNWYPSDQIPPEMPHEAFDAGEIIYSDLVFVIVDPIKGTSGTEEVICLHGGEVNGFVIYYDGPPSPWDFKQGNEYLIYASKSDGDGMLGSYYSILPGGIYNVIPS